MQHGAQMWVCSSEMHALMLFPPRFVPHCAKPPLRSTRPSTMRMKISCKKWCLLIIVRAVLNAWHCMPYARLAVVHVHVLLLNLQRLSSLLSDAGSEIPPEVGNLGTPRSVQLCTRLHHPVRLSRFALGGSCQDE